MSAYGISACPDSRLSMFSSAKLWQNNEWKNCFWYFYRNFPFFEKKITPVLVLQTVGSLKNRKNRAKKTENIR